MKPLFCKVCYILCNKCIQCEPDPNCPICGGTGLKKVNTPETSFQTCDDKYLQLCDRCIKCEPDPNCHSCKGIGIKGIIFKEFKEEVLIKDSLELQIFIEKLSWLKRFLISIIIISIFSTVFSFISVFLTIIPEIGLISLICSAISTICSIIGYCVSPDPDLFNVKGAKIYNKNPKYKVFKKICSMINSKFNKNLKQ